MTHLRFAAGFAVVTLGLCILIAIDPITMANTILRRPVAQPGDPAFTLFYRLVAIVGALAALYILVGALWTLAHA